MSALIFLTFGLPALYILWRVIDEIVGRCVMRRMERQLGIRRRR
jgi:hypothetical protein